MREEATVANETLHETEAEWKAGTQRAEQQFRRLECV
jgi:hypothetical protein